MHSHGYNISLNVCYKRLVYIINRLLQNNSNLKNINTKIDSQINIIITKDDDDDDKTQQKKWSSLLQKMKLFRRRHIKKKFK